MVKVTESKMTVKVVVVLVNKMMAKVVKKSVKTVTVQEKNLVLVEVLVKEMVFHLLTVIQTLPVKKKLQSILMNFGITLIQKMRN